MISAFIEYIKFEKRYSEHTILSYRKDLECFQNFLESTVGVGNTLDVDRKKIKGFIANLSEKKISKRSINRKLSSLRSYYRYLLRLGAVEVSPMEGIESLKFYPKRQLPFSEEEMSQLLENIKNAENTLDYLILETLYQTGMRRAELCSLLVQNVDFDNAELRVLGKGNKIRIIPMATPLVQSLEHYYRKERNPLPDAEPYFFVKPNGKKLTEKFVYSVVNRYLSLVSTKQKKSPHILRHTFATHILDRGAEISKVKEILGHASLASTQVYTAANIQKLKKVLNASHPRGDNNTN